MKKKVIMKNILTLFAVAAAALLFCGCASPDPVVFSEVLQLQKNQKIYTAWNLWYDSSCKIDSRNVQQGSFLPLGTEIEPVSADNNSRKIVFTAGGKTYTINFDSGIRLCTMRDFIGYTFTVKTKEELLKDIPSEIRQRIVRGEVVPGMDRRQVELAYGPVPAARTPDTRNETWVYWTSDTKTLRLIFRGDVVRQILDAGI